MVTHPAHAEPVHPVQVWDERPPARQIGALQSRTAGVQLQPVPVGETPHRQVVVERVIRVVHIAESIVVQSVIVAGALPQPVAGAQVAL